MDMMRDKDGSGEILALSKAQCLLSGNRSCIEELAGEKNVREYRFEDPF